jgi:hypothetical protein
MNLFIPCALLFLFRRAKDRLVSYADFVCMLKAVSHSRLKKANLIASPGAASHILKRTGLVGSKNTNNADVYGRTHE